MREILSLFAALVLSVLAYAQEKTITGTVITANGDPVPFATVKIKANKRGTSADADGIFTIKAKTGDVLVISGATITPKEVTVGAESVLKIAVEVQTANMTEVVVTALGIRRKADNLSYATQGLSSSKLTTTRITDINTALAGKIAGVQVRTQPSAKLGSASSIRLRGAASLNDKSPLYVVDGTPIDDISAINIDDVDDVQVLKGPAATALYGQRADAGVLMLTTRKAKKKQGLGVELNSSTVLNTVGNLPKYQNEYAGGTPGAGWQTFTWAAGMPEEWKALDGQKYHTYFDDASWGPKIDGSDYIPWYAWFPGTKYSFKTAKLTAQPDNIRDFYDHGVQLINNIALSKSADNYSIRFSYTNQDEKGLIPYSYLKKNSFSTQVAVNLSPHLSANANINFVSQKVRGEFSDTYSNNASGSFNQWFHRDLDVNVLKELKNLRTPTGRLPGWNLNDFNGIDEAAINDGTLYWTNPFAYYDLAKEINITDRLFGDVGLTYKFDNRFSIAGFVRRNQRNTNSESFLPVIFEISTEDMSSPLAINEATTSTINGRPVRATYRNYTIKSLESNYEFLSSYSDKYGDIGLDVNIGGNIRENSYSSLDAGTKGGLVVPDLFTLSNSKIQPFYYANTRNRKTVRSLYGRGSLHWQDVVVLDFSLRNDWSSALPENNNSYLYPSVGASFIFSKYLQSLSFLSFAKIRGSWAQVGSDLDPYQLALSYTVGNNQWNDNITMTTPDKLVDPNIKPALSSAYETGIDLRFLNNRISFSGTYYNERKINEILNIPVTGTSGFSTKLINAGEIRRSGIELFAEAVPVQSKSFQWNVSVNFAKNTSKVIDLYPDIDVYYQAGSDYSRNDGTAAYAPAIWHIRNGEWGQLRGRGIKRINGQPILDAAGLYVYENNVNFGSVLPDFTGGFVNQLSYKDFSLSFAIDFLKGGKYFSLSDHWGSFSGLYDYTAGLNDKGKPVRDAVADGGGVHVKGVDQDGKPKDVYVDAIDYFQGNGVNRINEMHVFDLDYIKLREVNLTYRFPLKRLGTASKYLQNLQLSAFARNPWLIYAANRNFDPSELVGAYGESGQLPPSRSFGVTIKAGF